MKLSDTELRKLVDQDESEMLEFKENYGGGIQRIFDKCHELDFPEPVFKELDGGFQVTFHKDIYND